MTIVIKPTVLVQSLFGRSPVLSTGGGGVLSAYPSEPLSLMPKRGRRWFWRKGAKRERSHAQGLFGGVHHHASPERLLTGRRDKAVDVFFLDAVIGIVKFALDGCKAVLVLELGDKINTGIAAAPTVFSRPFPEGFYIFVLLNLNGVIA